MVFVMLLCSLYSIVRKRIHVYKFMVYFTHLGHDNSGMTVTLHKASRVLKLFWCFKRVLPGVKV